MLLGSYGCFINSLVISSNAFSYINSISDYESKLSHFSTIVSNLQYKLKMSVSLNADNYGLLDC